MNAAPPSEPDWQVSRIRLSSQKLATTRRLMSSSFQAFQVEDAQRVPDGQGLSPRRIVTLHSAAAPSKLRGIKMIPLRQTKNPPDLSGWRVFESI